MRRSVLALVVLALLATGCVGPTATDLEYREAAVDSLEHVRGRVDAARITAEAAGRDRLLQGHLATTMGELEHSIAYVHDAFATRQPPSSASDDVRSSTLPLLHDASSLLAELRIAAFRGDSGAIGEQADALADLATRLEERAKEVAP